MRAQGPVSPLTCHLVPDVSDICDMMGVHRASFPDFRHQHNSWDALWLEDAPQRAAEAVVRLDADSSRDGKVLHMMPMQPRLPVM